MRHNNHARRPRFYLPAGIDLADFDFVPDKYELLANRLRQMTREWDLADDKQRKERAAAIEREIESDRRKQAAAEAREEIKRKHEEQFARVHNYWLKERESGADQMTKLIAKYEAELNWRHTQQLEKLAEITKEIAQDRLRAEKNVLLAKGLVRGRRR